MVNKSHTKAESEHLARVKSLPCSVCNKEGPGYAHHPDQDCDWTTIALCWDCHQGPEGWHGTKAIWRVYKMDEMKALGVTIKRLLAKS